MAVETAPDPAAAMAARKPGELAVQDADNQWGATPAVAWFTVGILLAMAAVSYLDRTIISLLVEPIKHELGISDSEIGLLQGLGFGLVYALFGLPLGWLVDRFSRRWVLYLGVSAWSLATASCGLANTYLHLMLGRFGVGAGEAALSPAAYSIIADLFPQRRMALAMGVFATGASLGAAVALALGGMLIDALTAAGNFRLPGGGELQPWQAAFVLVSLPGLLLAVAIFLVPEPARRSFRAVVPAAAGESAGVDAGAESFSSFLRRRWRYLAAHMWGFGLLATAAYGLAAWMPAFLIRNFDMQIGPAGVAMALVSGPFGVVGFVASGWVADHWFAKGVRDAHFRYFIVGCPLMLLAALGAFVYLHNLYAVLASTALLFLLLPFTAPAAAHLQIVTPSHLRGRVSALFVMVFNLLGLCFGPSLVALFTDYIFGDPAKVGWSLALLFSLLLPVVFLTFLGNLRIFRQAATGP